jgi:thioredoxin 1
MATAYIPSADAPTRDEIDHAQGLVLLEFGTDWCGICRALAPHVESLVQKHSQVRHLKVEDGPGRPLGRSFRVKLWPTLVFLKDGQEVARVTRPGSQQELDEALAKIV